MSCDEMIVDRRSADREAIREHAYETSGKLNLYRLTNLILVIDIEYMYN